MSVTTIKKLMIKDPQAILDYNIDWEEWLNGDTVLTSVWTVPAGLINYGTNTIPSGLVTVWIGSGTIGTIYELVNRITTAGGRVDERSIFIKITNVQV